MSSVLYFEPLYLDRLVDPAVSRGPPCGISSLVPGGIPNSVMSGGIPSVMSGGIPSVMSGGIPSVMSGGIPSVMPGGVPSSMSGGIPNVIFPTTATQKPVDILAAMKLLKPTMDLYEDIQENVVTATFEFPGLSKDDVQINFQAGKLIVSAENRSEEYAETGYAVRERRFGKFSRTLQLPQGVKEEEVKASMENGVLTVTFPKLTPELTPKRICIS